MKRIAKSMELRGIQTPLRRFIPDYVKLRVTEHIPSLNSAHGGTVGSATFFWRLLRARGSVAVLLGHAGLPSSALYPAKL